jgi:hypothetical protein
MNAVDTQDAFDRLAAQSLRALELAQIGAGMLAEAGADLQRTLTLVMALPSCGPQRLQLIQQLITAIGQLETACAAVSGK